MNKQMLEIMQRRGELLARIAAQREQVAEAGARWKAPLALADRGLAAARFLRARPLLVAGIAALFVIRRRGAAGMVTGAWRMWKLYKSAVSFSAKMTARL